MKVRRHRLGRAVVSATIAAAGLVALATPVAAHVTVEPAEAPSGATVDLVFSVPNERSSATVRLELEVPDGLTVVRPTAPAGWTASVSGQVVTWAGGRIEGDARERFPITLGPLPTGTTVVFPAAQTYEDGVVVRWLDRTTSGATGRPAAALTLTAPLPTTTSTTSAAPPASTTSTTAAVGTAQDDADRGSERESRSGTAAFAFVLAGLGLASILGWIGFAWWQGRQNEARWERIRLEDPEGAASDPRGGPVRP